MAKVKGDNNSILHVKVNGAVKKEFDIICQAGGENMSDVVRKFISSMVKRGKL